MCHFVCNTVCLKALEINEMDAPNASALIVFAHGLQSNPKQFTWHVDALREAVPGAALWIPKLPKLGDAPLDELVETIYVPTRRWMLANPGKPIVLIGTSNGGRIMLEVSTQLSAAPPAAPNSILLVSIAGAIGGSKLLALGNTLGVTRLMFSPALRNELEWNSQCVNDLVDRAAEASKQRVVQYLFIGATAELETQLATSLAPFPILNGDQWNVLVRRMAHSGIVMYTAPMVVTAVQEWIEQGNLHSARDFIAHADVIAHEKLSDGRPVAA